MTLLHQTRFNKLFGAPYMFHLHTTYTDGELSAGDYFEFARRHGAPRLIFLEHIRRTPRYDVQQFISEVRECEKRFSGRATIGFEAKVLPGGGLDISEDHLKEAEVLGIAEHGFDGTLMELRESLSVAMRHDWGRPCVWVHPGLGLRRKAKLENQPFQYTGLLEEALANGVALERNQRYDLISEKHSHSFAEGIVFGLDAHAQSDLTGYDSPALHGSIAS